MASNGTNPAATEGNELPIVLGVIIPLLLVLVVVILLLSALLVWLAVKQRAKKNYRPLSKKDALPYPPLVKLDQPPNPNLTYTLAANLDPGGLVEGRATSPLLHRHQRAVSPRRGSSPEPPRLERPKRLSRRRPAAAAMRRHSMFTSSERYTRTVDSLTPDRTPERVLTPESSDHSGESDYPPTLRMYLLNANVQKSDSIISAIKLPDIHFILCYKEQSSSLLVRVERVNNLPLREDGSEVNAFVRLYFTPMQVMLRKISRTGMTRTSDPVFDEEIMYEAMNKDDLDNSTLHLEVVDYQAYGKQWVIGRNQLALRRVTYSNGEAKVQLSLPPPLRFGEYCGVILLSLCYDQLNKKLSVIILRAKDLNKGKSDETDVQAKITICHRSSAICKLKTKKKQGSCSPIFNEAVSCVVDPSKLKDVKVEITLVNDNSKAKQREMGFLTLGSQSSGEQLRHWNDMLASPGKHLSEWHELHCW